MSKLSHTRAYSDRYNLDHRMVAGNSETVHVHGEHKSHSSAVPGVVQGSNETKNKNTRKVVRALRTSSSRATDMSPRLDKSSRIDAQFRVQPRAKHTADLLSRSNNRNISNWDSAEAGRYGTARSKSRNNGRVRESTQVTRALMMMIMRMKIFPATVLTKLRKHPHGKAHQQRMNLQNQMQTALARLSMMTLNNKVYSVKELWSTFVLRSKSRPRSLLLSRKSSERIIQTPWFCLK